MGSLRKALHHIIFGFGVWWTFWWAMHFILSYPPIYNWLDELDQGYTTDSTEGIPDTKQPVYNLYEVTNTHNA